LAKSRLRWNFQKGVNANLELSAVAGIIIIYIFMDVPNSTSNGWRVSEVLFGAFWLQPFNRLLAEVTLR
jgi:hypothetical protein